MEPSRIEGMTTFIAQAQDRLQEAALIVETVVYDMAGEIDRAQLSRLILIAAELERVQLKLPARGEAQKPG